LGVDHLISHGHKRIAYLGDYLGIDTARSRLDGYRESLELAGIPMRDDYVIGMDPSLADSGPIVEALLATPDPPTAIFSANTRCSLRVLTTLHRLRRTDIAFVSFGDFAMADVLTPPITVVDHSPEFIGRLAADRLLRRMAGDEMQTQTITTPLHLVPRGSGELAP
jgi:LacI family transcriptional regulator